MTKMKTLKKTEESIIRKLVEQFLLSETFAGEDMTKSIEYTGFLLDEDSHRELAKFAPPGWKVFAHHMTMIPPSEQKTRLPRNQFYEGDLRVTGIAKNDKVIAVRVAAEDKNLYNKLVGLPHITIATNPEKGGKPQMSNEFEESDFKELEKDIIVRGKVKEVFRN